MADKERAPKSDFLRPSNARSAKPYLTLGERIAAASRALERGDEATASYLLTEQERAPLRRAEGGRG